jgi:hypothetical protein
MWRGEFPWMGLLLFFNILSIFPYLNGIPTFGMEDLGNVTFWGQKFGGLSDKCSKIIHLNKV